MLGRESHGPCRSPTEPIVGLHRALMLHCG